MSAPVWDEQLIIQAQKLNKEALSHSQIEISAYDADMTGRDLIGSFFVDAVTVYFQENHEIYNTWVALSAPYAARKGLFSSAPGGIVGYVKLSITLLGPEDTPPVHEEEDDDDEAEHAVLMPPTLKREVVFVRVA
eukprot:3573382-Prymnesium_polylepis.1